MNVPVDVARQVVDQLRGSPFLLVLLLINMIVLAGFWITLSHVADAMERREKILERCLR